MIINWDILKQPLNWVIILLMLLIAGVAGHLVLSYVGKQSATSDDSKTT